jgi:hypothetical protein
MSNRFNARFDLTSSILVGPAVWNIVGAVVDNTGNFGSGDVLLGDIIYNDGNILGQGPLRYKIISIQSVVNSDVQCSVQWEVPGETAIEPIVGSSGLIGRPDTNSIIPIPDALQQSIDTAFCNSVRNMESIILSRIVNGITIPVGIMMQEQYDKDIDLKIDVEALPNIDPGHF